MNLYYRMVYTDHRGFIEILTCNASSPEEALGKLSEDFFLELKQFIAFNDDDADNKAFFVLDDRFYNLKLKEMQERLRKETRERLRKETQKRS